MLLQQRSRIRNRVRRAGRPGAVAVVAVTVLAGASLAAVPPAQAEGGLGNSTAITSVGPDDTMVLSGNGVAVSYTGLAVSPGTHAAIATQAGCGCGDWAYGLAYESNANVLSIAGDIGARSLGLAMMPHTSPAIAILRGGQYVIAFEGGDGNLWTTSNLPGAPLDWRLPMDQRSSPSITTDAHGGYIVAYQADTHELRLAGDVEQGTGYGMEPGTSPAIATPWQGGMEVAFQANTHQLYFYGNSVTENTGLGMDPNSSPTISGVLGPAGGWGFQAAFESPQDQLWTDGAYGGAAYLGSPMRPGTSPAIVGAEAPINCDDSRASVPITGYDISFQGSDGLLHEGYNAILPNSGGRGLGWTENPVFTVSHGELAMDPAASPSETAIEDNGHLEILCGSNS
jgi:hypothetical protein